MAARRVAILGAGGGIGAACVAAFLAAGWETVGADLLAGRSDHQLDVTDPVGVDQFAQTIGPVDAMIYAAGSVATMPIAETDFAVWRRIMAVNLDGAAHAASAFARSIQGPDGTRGGAMVFVSSAAGVRGEANASAYSASKAGVIALVESIAAELVAANIRVNAVAPGNVDTPMLRNVAQGIAQTECRSVDAVWQSFAETGAANRILRPSEVADVCLALCGDGFSGVTGTTVRVDGGYLLA